MENAGQKKTSRKQEPMKRNSNSEEKWDSSICIGNMRWKDDTHEEEMMKTAVWDEGSGKVKGM